MPARVMRELRGGGLYHLQLFERSPIQRASVCCRKSPVFQKLPPEFDRIQWTDAALGSLFRKSASMTVVARKTLQISTLSNARNSSGADERHSRTFLPAHQVLVSFVYKHLRDQ